MSRFHTDIVGKPFFPSVRKELEKRKSLDQSSMDANFSTMYQPYVVLRRIGQVDIEKYNAGEQQYVSGRFSTLGKVKNDSYDISVGANGLTNGLTKYQNLNVITGITDIEIIQKDFTFFEINVNFKIGNIDDFQDFKKMWFSFGIPVEIEYGRKRLVNEPTEENDMSPYVQKMHGILVKFNYSSSNGRVITGSLKIYSMNFLLLQREATSTQEKMEEQLAEFKTFVQDRVINRFSKDEQIEQNFDTMRSLYFGVIDISDRQELTVSRNLTIAEALASARAGTNVINPSVTIDVPFTTKPIINARPLKPKTDLWEKINYFVNKFTLNNLNQNTVQERARLRTEDLSRAPRQVVNEFESKQREQEFSNKLEQFNQIVQSDYYERALSIMRLDNTEYGTDVYFFISVRAIEEFLNTQLLQERKEQKENPLECSVGTSTQSEEFDPKDLITRYDMSESVVKNVKRSGFSSKYPERILFDPHGVSDSDTNTIKLYDVYISIDLLQEIVSSSRSIFGIMDAVAEEIQGASNDMIKIRKTTLMNTDEQENFVSTYALTYVDIPASTDPDNTNHYVFDLYNPREKVQNLSVQTSISEDIEQYAFFNAKKIVNMGGTVVHCRPNQDDESNASVTNQPITRVSVLSENAMLLEYAMNFDTIRRQVSNIISNKIKSDSVDREVTAETVVLYFTYIRFIFDTLSELSKIIDEQVSPNSAIEIPLQLSFDIDGICGIIPTQAFKVSNTSFPIGYSFDDNSQYSYFVVNNQTHTMSNKWTTKISGLLYVTNAGRRESIFRAFSNRGEADELYEKYFENVRRVLSLNIYEPEVARQLVEKGTTETVMR
jgi:hypothetical protein